MESLERSSAMSAIPEVENLAKKDGDLEAVKGISFSVDEGEVFGLLGPNGTDKTQSISMMTGVISPSSGALRWHWLSSPSS
jgi:ABC-2 type transport system ATP-binding protein